MQRKGTMPVKPFTWGEHFSWNINVYVCDEPGCFCCWACARSEGRCHERARLMYLQFTQMKSGHACNMKTWSGSQLLCLYVKHFIFFFFFFSKVLLQAQSTCHFPHGGWRRRALIRKIMVAFLILSSKCFLTGCRAVLLTKFSLFQLTSLILTPRLWYPC